MLGTKVVFPAVDIWETHTMQNCVCVVSRQSTVAVVPIDHCLNVEISSTPSTGSLYIAKVFFFCLFSLNIPWSVVAALLQVSSCAYASIQGCSCLSNTAIISRNSLFGSGTLQWQANVTGANKSLCSTWFFPLYTGFWDVRLINSCRRHI